MKTSSYATLVSCALAAISFLLVACAVAVGQSDLSTLMRDLRASELRGEEFCSQTRDPKAVRYKKYDAIANYQVYVKIDPKWDGLTFPVPFEVTVCNHGVEPIEIILFNNPIVLDGMKEILPSNESRYIKVANGKLIGIRVDEVSNQGKRIAPGEAFSYPLAIGADYGLVRSKTYTVSVKKSLYLTRSKREVELLSPPVKFRLGP